MDPVLESANTRIINAIEHLKRELSTIRAGRANPTLIENVLVDAYGTKMKLMEVGTIAAPQPTLLTVQIWDAALTNDVLKSIQEANLGLNPVSDGSVIRLPIPQLTEERRLEFVKMAHQKMEQSKVDVRQIRQDVRAGWEKQQENSEFGEDELERRFHLLQSLIEKYTATIDELGREKELELTTI